MDNYPYTPFIDNSLLRRALPRPAANRVGLVNRPAQGLARDSSAPCSFPDPKIIKAKYSMFTFDCRGDFRKDEAALSYGADHGFREGPNSRLGTDQDQMGLGRTDFEQVRAKPPVGRIEQGLGRTNFEQVRAKPPVGRIEQGLGRTDFEQVRAKPPVGRIEQGLGRTDFEQVRAKTTRWKDRTGTRQNEFRASSGKTTRWKDRTGWQNEFRASSGKNHPSEGP